MLIPSTSVMQAHVYMYTLNLYIYVYTHVRLHIYIQNNKYTCMYIYSMFVYQDLCACVDGQVLIHVFLASPKQSFQDPVRLYMEFYWFYNQKLYWFYNQNLPKNGFGLTRFIDTGVIHGSQLTVRQHLARLRSGLRVHCPGPMPEGPRRAPASRMACLKSQRLVLMGFFSIRSTKGHFQSAKGCVQSILGYFQPIMGYFQSIMGYFGVL